MRNLIQVFKFEFLRLGKRRAYLFTTFIVPLIAISLMFGYEAYKDWQASRETDTQVEDDSSVGKLGYVDESGMFPEPGLFGTALTRYDDVESAADLVRAGALDAVYLVPGDYLETGEVKVYIDTFSLENMTTDGFFRAFLVSNLLRDVDRNLVQRLQSEPVIVQHQVAETGETTVAKSEGASFLLVYVFALLLAFAVFFSGGYLLQGVVEEKETRMVEVLLSTVRPLQLLAGKVLASGLLGLGQITLWVLTAVFIMDRLGGLISGLVGLSVPPQMLLWMLLYFLAGFLFFSGGYAAIGAIAPSQREGPQLAVFITLPAMIPFYFLQITVETPNATLPLVMSLIPITAPMGMIQRLAVTTVPLGQILLSLFLLALATLGMIWLAARLFRVNTLLAGQMPRWRDLVRIVREG